ncbi:MAG: flagellar hook-basal body complex protein [Firmicutes bacterium]|nr:flagellar hook-basal body complex protein [Bacillota bacterium]
MIRSLYSGISGMRNHQTRMDVVGNNIANVNTTGYKSARVNFQDSLSQFVGPNPVLGRNQVGTGMKVGSINTNFVQGPLQSTGRTLDLAIQGEGFFAVKAMDNSGDLPPGGLPLVTREGIFFLDKNNTLVNSGGYAVLGYMNTAADKTTQPAAVNSGEGKITISPATHELSSLSIDKNGYITALNKATGNVEFIAQVALATFANQEGLEKRGQNLYAPGPASGTAKIASNNHATDGAKAEINSG